MQPEEDVRLIFWEQKDRLASVGLREVLNLLRAEELTVAVRRCC